MKNFYIKRITSISDGTFGVFLDSGIPFCLTLELPWNDNKPYLSCIPINNYVCERYSSKKHPNTFQVLNVPNRSFILFHKGNISDDTEGCIVLGEQYESYKGKIAVISSGKAFEEFLERTKTLNQFYLNITT